MNTVKGDKMRYLKIVLFGEHRTYTFKYCEVLTDNEYALVFGYQAQSDGVWRTMTAHKDKLLGWAGTPYDNMAGSPTK